jgi:hypothetical protein
LAPNIMSKKNQHYTQCTMHKATETGTLIDVAWIPSEFAHIGRHLVIRVKGVWVSGWYVVSKGSARPAHWVEAHERDYLKQREASDI